MIIEVRGWAEWDDSGPIPGSGAFNYVPDGESIRDVLSDPGEAEGLWLRAFDPDTGAEKFYWLWTYFSLTWDEWDDLIDGSTEMYFTSMA